MRMAQESSVMVVMPTKAPFERPQLPPLPISDAHTDDELQATPEHNSGSKRKRRATHDHDSSTTDEDGDLSKTLYECRFCNMRFAKSQALGGHMNRHRQEREKEQYQHAQQLVSSMAQQQIPRSWTSMTSEMNGATGAAAQLARLSTQPPSRPGDAGSSRPQLPPQISFTSTRLPLTPTSSAPVAPIPDSPSSNFYLPSNSSSSNLQHLHWNVDAGFNATTPTGLPRSGSLNALDSMTGSMRDDFLSGVLQPPPRHDSFGCQAQFSSVPLLNSRPGTFQDSIPGGPTGLQFPHDHVLRQLACTSALLNSTLMDAKPPGRPFMMQHCSNLAQFKQPQVSLPGPRPLGAGSQYHVMSPPSMFSGHSFNSPGFNNHEFTPQQDFDAGMQQYRQASSGSAASGSFDHDGGVYAHVKMQPNESESYNQICPDVGNAEQTNNTEVPVDGSTRCESMNITTVTDTGDVSGMSAPPRYQSTDFSSGSPEWRTQNNSPSGQANHASPPSQEYCSG